jgi:CII protein
MHLEPPPHQFVRVSGLSNSEFLLRYARPGCIGLSGGITLIDRAICRAERHLDPRHNWGAWSHAFVFEGNRADGHHWVIESDLQIHRKHIQLGVQENRISKYFDERLYTMLAVLDFGLSQEQIALLLREALDLVANRARYSLRELLGTFLALRRPELRARNNVLSRERSLYCSALVQHLFRKIGLDLAPGVDLKNTTPEDIARTQAPHITYCLERQRATSKLRQFRARLSKATARKSSSAVL